MTSYSPKFLPTGADKNIYKTHTDWALGPPKKGRKLRHVKWTRSTNPSQLKLTLPQKLEVKIVSKNIEEK
jgi:hypothetical protein